MKMPVRITDRIKATISCDSIFIVRSMAGFFFKDKSESEYWYSVFADMTP